MGRSNLTAKMMTSDPNPPHSGLDRPQLYGITYLSQMWSGLGQLWSGSPRLCWEQMV